MFSEIRPKYMKSFSVGYPYREVVEHAQKLDQFNVINHAHGLFNVVSKDITRDRVLVHLSLNIAPIRVYTCAILNEINKKGICHNTSRDAFDGIENTMCGNVMPRKFHDNPLSKKYLKYIRRSVDTGLELYRNMRLWHHNIIVTPETADCYSESIVTHNPDYESFSLINFQYAFMSLLIPLSLASFFLFGERCKRRKRK